MFNIKMKGLLVTILLLFIISLGLSANHYTISDSAGFANMNIASNDTVTIIGVYNVSSSWKLSHKNNVVITGDWHLNTTVTGKALDFAYLRHCKIEGGEIIATNTASAGFELWRSNYVTISLKIHGSQWGIRGFYDTNIVITNSMIYHTWDDNVYFGNYDQNIEVCYSIFDEPNTGYWNPGTSSSGDCIQTDGTQGFIYIHDNSFYRFETGWKFAVIIGNTTFSAGDSAVIRNNIFNVRTYAMRATENTSTHTVQGSSCVYLKVMNIVRMFNNYYYGGSNAIFTMGYASHSMILRVSNEVFSNQTQCISFGTNWNIQITNCTFLKGPYTTTYLLNDGGGDLISKCVFYGLSNPHYQLSGNYVFSDNLIDPETIPAGYGANPTTTIITNTNTVTIRDTIRLTVTNTIVNTVTVHDTIVRIRYRAVSTKAHLGFLR